MMSSDSSFHSFLGAPPSSARLTRKCRRLNRNRKTKIAFSQGYYILRLNIVKNKEKMKERVLFPYFLYNTIFSCKVMLEIGVEITFSIVSSSLIDFA